MQESVARAVGEFDEAKSFVRVVPLDDGSDGWTRGCFKTWDARPRRKSEVAGWRLVVVVVETTAAGRAKISVFGAQVGFLGELTLTLGFGRRIVNELLPRNGLPKENRAEGDGDRFRTGRLRELEGRCDG